jgi:hypothetical protein
MLVAAFVAVFFLNLILSHERGGIRKRKSGRDWEERITDSWWKLFGFSVFTNRNFSLPEKPEVCLEFGLLRSM